MGLFSRGLGQGVIEYALILVLVALTVIIAMYMLGPSIGNVYSEAAAEIDGVVAPPGATPTPLSSNPGPQCYGSLLLPYMAGFTGTLVAALHFLPDSQRVATEV
jgi:pilus assembly protein Flp/PilA